MKIRKIYFDMDGVLADFSLGVEELCGLPADCSDDKMWEAIKKVPHFYLKLKPMKNAIEMIQKVIEKYGADCEILTAVPKPKRGILTAGTDKIQWIREMVSDKMKVNIVIREEKKTFCTGKDCVLVDDLMGNIRDWEMNGGTGILFTTAENVLKKIEGIEEVC